MTAPDDVRARFEATFRKPPFEFSLKRWGDASAWPGQYRDYSVQCAWEGYRAAHADLAGEVRELVEADREYDEALHGLVPAFYTTVERLNKAMERRDAALAKFHPTQRAGGKDE